MLCKQVIATQGCDTGVSRLRHGREASVTVAPAPGDLPMVIQGGMGVGVSGWPLARAVSLTGQLGVVSGVALDTLLARRLQLGDPGGDIRRALASFPSADVSEPILGRYLVEGGLDQ